MPRARRIKNSAVLVGFDSRGDSVFAITLDLDSYWDDLHPVIDESAFRRTHGIRRLIGDLYGNAGQLIEHFENVYNGAGKLTASHGKHEDGTETRFP